MALDRIEEKGLAKFKPHEIMRYQIHFFVSLIARNNSKWNLNQYSDYLLNNCFEGFNSHVSVYDIF